MVARECCVAVMKDFGTEVILDLHECSTDKFTREGLTEYFVQLCKLLDMERCDLHFWDYEDKPEEYEKAPDHLKGISAIQFISTSNITVHTLDVLKRVYLNIFSCREFDSQAVHEFSAKFFGGQTVTCHAIKRA